MKKSAILMLLSIVAMGWPGTGLFSIPARAAAPPTCITVGHGWALVREWREVTVETGADSLILDRIPPDADLSSLRIGSSVYPVEWTGWERVTEPVADADSWRIEAEGVRWRNPERLSEQPAPVPSDRVICRIRPARLPNELTMELTYVTRNMDWDARYQIVVRGDREEEMEPVSVDLYGTARIHNGSSRVFSNAIIRLVGSARSPGARVSAPPGFLMVNEASSLSDLWLDPEEERPVNRAYDVPEPATLAARSETDIAFVHVRRKAADRVYTMKSESFPLDTADTLRPLNKQIVLFNDEAHGLGVALPPGPVEIFLGGQRTYRLQRAWFAHTPRGGRIRIDLGPAADVLGARRPAGVSPVTVGTYQSDFEILVSNRRNNDIRVEIDEQPSVGLEWSVLRAGKPYERVAKRLLFTPEIKAGDELVIDYRLTVQRPRL